ncbi:hypothetical protein FRC09_004937 [Ceratobasidium sp. 395]|nr:hypothetical protein FRC09_004937 [Ceratobasidium sp. 395]
MDSGILSLTLVINLVLVLVFVDLDIPSNILFLREAWSSLRSSISLVSSKPQTTSNHIPYGPLSEPPNTLIHEDKLSSTGEAKPSLKLDILAASKHRSSGRKLLSGLSAPTAKGGDDHLGTHTGCPTFFTIDSKHYVLFEDGKIYMHDEQGYFHSAAEIPLGAGGSCRIPGERFTLTLDEEAFLCKVDDNSLQSQRVTTWCLDNDPNVSGSPRVVPGRGCFHFRIAPPLGQPCGYLHGGKFGASLCDSLHGLGYSTSFQSPLVLSMFEIGANQSETPSPIPPTVSSESSPSSSRSPADYTIPNARTSLERRTCTHCNKVLRRPSALRIHINSHLNHKPFKCPKESCTYASTNETNLRRHVQKMHGEDYEEGLVHEE